jgi:hypothetical protein
MDYQKLLFALEVRKLVLERGKNQAKNMTPSEALAHVEKNGKAILHDVLDELGEYADAISAHYRGESA